MATPVLSPPTLHSQPLEASSELESSVPARDVSISPRSVSAQAEWAARPISSRLRILRGARHELAALAPEITGSISSALARTPADTMAAEILPLLEAIRFLERNAGRILRTQRLGRRGRPFWLSGLDAAIHRVPFGRVLVIGPANFPLFLPGAQTFQALAAGNAVLWKPGLGGAPVARLVADVLLRAGLPAGLLEVTEDTVAACQVALSAGVDKVFFTGSATTGRLILRQLAETATPAVAELSGSDAVVVLPSADLDRVVAALAFGMRLNGSAICMAPRRILLVNFSSPRRDLFLEQLQSALAEVAPVTLSSPVRRQLAALIEDARSRGATVIGDPEGEAIRPILLLRGTPGMEAAQTDIFAPLLTLIEVPDTDGVLRAQAACPLALTAAIFGEEREARRLASQIPCGTVILNDLIVPTADPRLPFGGRRGSGFGVTRGAEGLLEMTAVKVVAARRNRETRHFDATGEPHQALFGAIISAAHTRKLRERWSGFGRAFAAAMRLNRK